ncbi:MAG: hypothetical protein SV186_07085 [Candidatus Nanohaloarchaea archaeon]|nr:hypothetical protein [Candidatus Nanohaloarchaea archaeon]
MTDDMLTGEERRYREFMADVFVGLEADDIEPYEHDQLRIEYGDGSKRYTLTQEDFDEITGDMLDDALERYHEDGDDAPEPEAVAALAEAHTARDDLPTEDELEEWRDPVEDMRVALTSTTGFNVAEYVDDSKYDDWQDGGLDAFLDYPDETDEFDGFRDWYDQTVRNLELMDYDEPERILTEIANLPYDEPVHDVPDRSVTAKVQAAVSSLLSGGERVGPA